MAECEKETRFQGHVITYGACKKTWVLIPKPETIKKKKSLYVYLCLVNPLVQKQFIQYPGSHEYVSIAHKSKTLKAN